MKLSEIPVCQSEIPECQSEIPECQGSELHPLGYSAPSSSTQTPCSWMLLPPQIFPVCTSAPFPDPCQAAWVCVNSLASESSQGTDECYLLPALLRAGVWAEGQLI